MFKQAILGAAALAALTFAAPFAASVAKAHDYTVGDLKVHHPYSRATPPGARTGAGYLRIENTGSADDRLVAVTCDCAEASEIHEMSMDNNVMRMRQLPDGLAVPAGETVALEPRGYHLMFIGLKQPFVLDEAFEATLTFEKAGEVTVEFAIDTPQGGKATGHHNHHGKGHDKTH